MSGFVNVFELGKHMYLTLMLTFLAGPPSPSNGNNMSRTDCLQPRSTGYCKRYSVRWYFDGEYGVCRPFVYGGCGGNKNNFQTQVECSSACSHAGILYLQPRLPNLSGVIRYINGGGHTSRPLLLGVSAILDFNTWKILGTTRLEFYLGKLKAKFKLSTLYIVVSSFL